MTIKLKKNQLEALHTLLTAALILTPPKDMAGSLLHELVDGINDRIRSKLKKAQYDNRVGYGLKLKSIDAKALYVWYLHIEAGLKESNHYQYECIIARNIVNQIDKEYA